MADTLGSPTERLTFTAFGTLMLARQGNRDELDRIGFSRKRVRQLLGMLILCDRIAVSEVLRALWPTLPDHEARNNLAATVRFARRIVDTQRGLRTDPVRSTSLIMRDATHIRLHSQNHLTTDLWEVRRLLALAKRRRASGDMKAAMQAVAEAMPYWTGPLLPDLFDLEPFGAWCVAELQELVSAALDLAEWSLSQGDFGSASRTARTVLASDGFDERAHAALIRALLELNDPTAVAIAVAECRASLLELGVEPNRTLAMILRRPDRDAGSPDR